MAKIERDPAFFSDNELSSSKRNVNFDKTPRIDRPNFLIHINFIKVIRACTFAVQHICMSELTLDILAFGAHPDDVEISCGATILKAIEEGNKVGIIDLTAGELGSRGSKESRLKEAEQASRILGLSIRENLDFRDCHFQNDEWHRLKIIEKIRQYRPRTVLVNSPNDRHPDHAKASVLVREACFYSGLVKLESRLDGVLQPAFRPQSVFMYIQDYHVNPSFVVNVSGYWEKKVNVLKCYSSQFYNPDASEPKTPISGEEFFDFLYGKALGFGRPCGFLLGEGFVVDRYTGVESINHVI